MADFEGMYYYLFNQISDAVTALEAAGNQLKAAQQAGEEMFMNTVRSSDRPRDMEGGRYIE